MSITPRSEIRTWIREQLDAGASKDDITFAAIQHFLERDDIIAELVSAAVKAEANKVIGTMVRIITPRKIEAVKRDIEKEAATLPAESALGKLTPAFDDRRASRILVDLAQMTKPQVLNLARDLESAAQKNEELAAFCHAIAADLPDGQTVGQAFTREHLLNLRHRLTTVSTTRVFLGQRQVAISERTN